MLDKVRRSWRTLKNAPSGERFQRYHRREGEAARAAWKRAVSLVVASVILVAGVVALPMPGPGTIVLVIGLALLARELAVVARALDALELRIVRVVSRLRRSWRAAGKVGQLGWAVFAGVLALTLLAAAAWAAYQVLR